MSEAATPIERARNIGPISAAELRAAGIGTVEQLRGEGWRACFERLVESFPERINLNMATALMAAELDCDWRRLPPAHKAEARAVVERLRAARRG